MIGFRVDANEKVATGHLMRCMVIAKELKKRGEEVCFFVAQDTETERLKKQGIHYEVLSSQWDQLEKELPELEKLLCQYGITELFVDSYQVTAHYLEELQQYVKVIYIDDMGEFFCQVSAVLHYSSWPDETAYEERYQDTGILCMTGMKYVPLREEFYPAQKKRKKKNILITTGGTDPYNVAGKVLEYFLSKPCPDMHFLVVAGSMNQNKHMLKKLEAENETIHLYENVAQMGNVMRESYLAVSAGGTTLFELCACKVPTVCFSFADNQEEFTKKMGQQNVMEYAGDARKEKTLAAKIYEKIMFLWNHDALCGQRREKMGALVDGKGAGRIADCVYGELRGEK